ISKNKNSSLLDLLFRMGGDANSQFKGKLAVGFPFVSNPVDSINDDPYRYVNKFTGGETLSVNGRAKAFPAVNDSDLVIKAQIASLATQAANNIFAGPSSGSAALPSFRPLVAADIPVIPFTDVTGTVPVSQGGTGLTAVGANTSVLTSNGSTLSWVI